MPRKEYKTPSAQPVLSKKQRPAVPFSDQRECHRCQSENFKVFMGLSPGTKEQGYLVQCLHCGYSKWLLGKRNS